MQSDIEWERKRIISSEYVFDVFKVLFGFNRSFILVGNVNSLLSHTFTQSHRRNKETLGARKRHLSTTNLSRMFSIKTETFFVLSEKLRKAQTCEKRYNANKCIAFL